jgi:hypothetical protein
LVLLSRLFSREYYLSQFLQKSGRLTIVKKRFLKPIDLQFQHVTFGVAVYTKDLARVILGYVGFSFGPFSPSVGRLYSLKLARTPHMIDGSGSFRHFV